METGKFFMIDQRSWARICDFGGLNAAVAYLVLACGTGANNRVTNWSANAIERYAGISRGRAKAAIHILCDNGMVRALRDGTKPQYQLAVHDGQPSWIWLPNELVTGILCLQQHLPACRRSVGGR